MWRLATNLKRKTKLRLLSDMFDIMIVVIIVVLKELFYKKYF
jgi:hypothetical protein